MSAMSRPLGPGTSLASLEVDVSRGQRNQHFLSIMRARFWRPYLGALAFYAVIGATMISAGLPGGRVAALGGVVLAHTIAHLLMLRWVVRPQRVERAVVIGSATILILMSALVAVTGGLDSPLAVCLPVLLLPAALMLGAGLPLRVMGLALVCFFLALLAAPSWMVGPPWPAAQGHALRAVALIWAIGALFLFTGRVGAATRAAADALGDLREERLALELGHLRRLQSVGAKVAHELKNPLAAVKGLVQLVARSADAERATERLEVVQGEVSRMETILHEYLSFARPLEDLAPTAVDLAEVAEDVVAVLAGRADQSDVAVAVLGPEVRLQADRRRLKEALLNVVANAIDFTPAGGRVEVEVSPREGGGRLVVRDTGRGIAAEDLSRVGTSFFTTRDSGTGLGVVLARNVITQHGGTFALTSEAGRGTTVTIELPSVPTASALPGVGRGGPT
jgi:signal transduction histidine kinase